jgi:thiamine pyrophosphate-dependent acetolactate synthase large subunit-like protein
MPSARLGQRLAPACGAIAPPKITPLNSSGSMVRLPGSRLSPEKPIHPLRVIRAVRQALPREATVAIDVGCLAQHMAGSLPAFPVHLPRSLIVPSSFYGMGFAGSALPVARQVYPDRPAVGFIGDGSFQMMLHVLPMAAEYRLGVTWCILNDRALGSIRDIQEFGMGNRIIDTDFRVQPDFAKIAQACECYGEQPSSRIRKALTERLRARSPPTKKAFRRFWISSSRARACNRPTNITLFMDEASAREIMRAREE